MSKKFTLNDPIHGRISLSDEEKRVVEHPYFQRLRRVKALGFLDRVFPSAKHSRFEHSIGACHVIGRLFDELQKVTCQLQENQWCEESEFKVLSSKDSQHWFSDENKRHLRLAALMHDVGHGPFSHASEVMMPLRKELLSQNPDASPFVQEYLSKNSDKQADHEDYSLLIMDSILRSSRSYQEDEIKRIASLKHEGIAPPAGLKEQITLFRDLVSGEFDSDRMDYLLRDSYFCGVPYGRFDLERLLEGICLLQTKDEKKFSLGMRRSSLTAFEHFLFARFQMYSQIYTHFVDAACNTAFEVIARGSGYVLPAKVEEYVEKDDENILDVRELGRAREQLRNRKLWITAFETFRNDNKVDSVVFDRIRKEIGEEYAEIYERDKPMKKPHLLKLPVITKNIRGELVTEEVREVSRMIADYNAIHVVRRVFVDPQKEEELKRILGEIGGNQLVSAQGLEPLSKEEIDQKIAEKRIVASEKPKNDKLNLPKTGNGKG